MFWDSDMTGSFQKDPGKFHKVQNNHGARIQLESESHPFIAVQFSPAPGRLLPGVREKQPREGRVRRPESKSWLPQCLTLVQATPNLQMRAISGMAGNNVVERIRNVFTQIGRPEKLLFIY